MNTIGVICAPDDAVFGRAAERLAARGFDVEFLPPDEPIEPATENKHPIRVLGIL